LCNRSFRRQNISRNLLEQTEKLKNKRLYHRIETLELLFHGKEDIEKIFKNLSPFLTFTKNLTISVSSENKFDHSIANYFPHSTVENLNLTFYSSVKIKFSFKFILKKFFFSYC
jgi:hypothetical protein